MKIITSILFLSILTLSCSSIKHSSIKNEELNPIRVEQTSSDKSNNTSGQIATFLTFQKENAEQAMNLYVSLFDNSEIIDIKRWGEVGPGKEGTIMQATFTLNGKLFMCSDSPAIHEWDFTPAVSNFVECKNEEELNRLFTKLSENGKVMMPLNNYGFSQKFGFIEDQFGVSWQLNLK